VRAFGINAYHSVAAGDHLIGRHDELGSGAGGHAELYVVTTGRATFTVDGEEIDAPTGTVVYVPDPASIREATAVEAGTSAIVVGGPADRKLPISPFEYWYIAQGPYNEGDYDKAIEIVEEGFAEHPGHPTFHYQLACYHALAGRREQALDHFERSCAGSPKAKEWQDGDADLDSIRDDPRFLAALASIPGA
jgi:tetratricopeptide (TPR) repeat protein